MDEITAIELENYAMSDRFATTNKRLAQQGIAYNHNWQQLRMPWTNHLRNTVLPRYNIEFGPVGATNTTLELSGAALMDYYRIHPFPDSP